MILMSTFSAHLFLNIFIKWEALHFCFLFPWAQETVCIHVVPMVLDYWLSKMVNTRRGKYQTRSTSVGFEDVSTKTNMHGVRMRGINSKLPHLDVPTVYRLKEVTYHLPILLRSLLHDDLVNSNAFMLAIKSQTYLIWTQMKEMMYLSFIFWSVGFLAKNLNQMLVFLILLLQLIL